MNNSGNISLYAPALPAGAFLRPSEKRKAFKRTHTGALDSRNSRNLMRLLRMMNEKYGATILTVTHDPAVAAYATRVLFLRDGRLFDETSRGGRTDDELFREIVAINAAAGGEDYAV